MDNISIYNNNEENNNYQDFNYKKMYPSVAETFAGQTVFLTGGTGFLGKLTLEKLLRSCPDVKKIYLVVRCKKGKNQTQRKKEMFENEIFEPLKRKSTEYFEEKVEILNGDLGLPELGLSQEDRDKLIAEVNFVFHLAATVRFDEKIKRAVDINVKATRDILKLAKQMTQIKGFVYVSTAYSFCPLNEIDEKFYKPPMEADKLINLMDSSDEDLQDYLTPKLIQSWPNTYVFTKSIAEDVVRRESKGIPLTIVRPSIVMSTYKEPLSGWTDNYYGAIGAMVGGALGLIRTIKTKLDHVADLVPADFVINCIIASVWEVANNQERYSNTEIFSESTDDKIKIYNCVSGPVNPITWGDMFKNVEECGVLVPSTFCVWHYFFVPTMSERLYQIYSFFLHTLPAHLVDFICVQIGKKPQMVRGYEKIIKFLHVIHYFSMRQWTFHNNNTKKLWYQLSPRDRMTYQFNLKLLKWDHFFYSCIRGARVYLVKDPMSTLDEGKAHYRKLKIYHYTLLTTLAFLFIGIIYLVLRIIFRVMF